MQIPDPIRPYADLIRWCLAVLLAGGLFVTGCQRGEDRQAAKDQDTIAKAEKQLGKAEAKAAENLRAANACGLLLEQVNDQTQASINAAELARKVAAEAASRAEAAAAEGRRRASEAEKALQAAKTKPVCRSQLEMQLCDSIPLL